MPSTGRSRSRAQKTKSRYFTQLEKASTQLTQLVEQLPSEAPTFAERIRPIAKRVDVLVEDGARVRALFEKGETAQALELMYAAVDPNFKLSRQSEHLTSEVGRFLSTVRAA